MPTMILWISANVLRTLFLEAENVMRNWIGFVAGAVIVALGTLQSNLKASNCDVCCPGVVNSCCSDHSCGDVLRFFAESDIQFDGWIDAGYMGNTSSPDSRFHGPYNAVDRSDEAMLNQIYLVAEKALPTCGHGIGGRIDYLYGEDYLLAESIGMEKRPDGSARWNKVGTVIRRVS